MQPIVEKLKQSRIKTTIVISADDRKKAEEAALVKLGQNIEIKGFRQGKAPSSLIRERVKDDDLLEQVVSYLLPGIVTESLKLSGAKPVIRPVANIKSFDPLTIELIFVERPAVILRKPEKISVEKKKPQEATAEEINDFIKKIMMHDRTETLADRPAAKGDLVRMSLSAKDEKGTMVQELVIGHYNILMGSDDLLSELEPALIGMKKGEKKTAEVSFPQDHDITTVRGKKIQVEMNVKEVAEVKMPELTAEYIKTRLGADRTPEVFKADIKEMLTRKNREQELKRREEELFEKVSQSTSVDLAPEFIETEVREMLHDLGERLKKQQMTMEDWLKSTGKEAKTVTDEMRKIAADRITLRFGMQELAKHLKTEPAEDEIKKALAEAQKNDSHAGHHHPEEDSLSGGALYEDVRWELTIRKLMEEIIGEVTPTSL